MIMNGRLRAHSPVGDLRSAEARQGRIIVETNDHDAESHLRSLKTVQSVELLAEIEGWRRVAVRAKADAGNVRESIQSRLAANGSVIRELHQETPTMEDIFFHLSSRKANSK